MLKFQKFLTEEQRFQQLLNEMLIQYNNGARYGQVVFLAGGGGSGKGFATEKFIDSSGFKIVNIDDYKVLAIKMAKKFDEWRKKYPDLPNLNLKNPKDVAKLHKLVKERGWAKNLQSNLVTGYHDPETLPNIMFDKTISEFNDLTKILPDLIVAGYKPENIHLTWVFTNYRIAAENNANRSRTIPLRILLGAHKDVAETMVGIMKGGLPKSINGSVQIIFNNPEYTKVYIQDTQKNLKGETKNRMVIKDFMYVTVKKSGKAMLSMKEINDEVSRKFGQHGKIRQNLIKMIRTNAPKATKRS